MFLLNLSGGSRCAVYGWGLDSTAVPQATNLALGIFGGIATLVAGAQWVRRRALARAAGGNRCLEDPPSVCKGLPGFLAIPLMQALWNAGFNWAKADSPPAFAFKFGGNGTGNSQLIYRQAISADSSGHYVTKWGSSGTGDGQFYIVRGLAADSSGRVYVVDENDSQGHGRVQAFNNTGALLTAIN